MNPCTPYRDNAEHLRAEVARIEAELLQLEAGGPEGPGAPEADLVGLRRQLEERLAASLDAGVSPRLPWLGAALGLGGAELDLVVLAFAPLWEARVADLLRRLGGGRGRPTLGLATRLLERGGLGRAEGLELLAPHAPLRRHRVVELGAPEDAAPLAVELTLDERIAGFLLGRDHLDPRLEAFGRWAPPGRTLAELALPPASRDALAAWLAAGAEAGDARGRWAVLAGPRGSGRREAARALCRERGTALLEIEAPVLAEDPEAPRCLETLVREAQLYGAAVYLDCAGALVGPSAPRLLAARCRSTLELFQGWLIAADERPVPRGFEPTGKVRLELAFGPEGTRAPTPDGEIHAELLPAGG